MNRQKFRSGEVQLSMDALRHHALGRRRSPSAQEGQQRLGDWVGSLEGLSPGVGVQRRVLKAPSLPGAEDSGPVILPE